MFSVTLRCILEFLLLVRNTIYTILYPRAIIIDISTTFQRVCEKFHMQVHAKLFYCDIKSEPVKISLQMNWRYLFLNSYFYNNIAHSFIDVSFFAASVYSFLKCFTGKIYTCIYCDYFGKKVN